MSVESESHAEFSMNYSMSDSDLGLKIEPIMTQPTSEEDSQDAERDKAVSDVRRKRTIVIFAGVFIVTITLAVALAVYFFVVKNKLSSTASRATAIGSSNELAEGLRPTLAPTKPPVTAPTKSPVSTAPTSFPSATLAPVVAPTIAPTLAATTLAPVAAPSSLPSVAATLAPVVKPTFAPSVTTTFTPTFVLTKPPTDPPTDLPTNPPTNSSTEPPTVAEPTLVPILTFSPFPVDNPAPIVVASEAPIIPATEAPFSAPLLPPNGNGSPVFAPVSTRPIVAPPTAASDPTLPQPTAEVTSPPVETNSAVAFINLVVDDAVVDPKSLENPRSYQYLARQWLISVDNEIWASQQDADLMKQRFALVVMDLALDGQVRTASTSVCDWDGIECTQDTDTQKQVVSKIEWARKGLTGRLPREISLLKDNLWRMDLAENEIVGSLPSTFYSLSNLTHVYLHNNQLTGSISDSGIADMPQLVEVFFGHNQFTGTIPASWASLRQGDFSKPLRYLVLHHNKLSGPIPTNLNWDRMFYMDLGNNQLTGSVPADIQGWWDLRHLYLNSNQLTGSLPVTFGTGAGNGRLIELDISDNQLTGVFPGDWGAMRTLVYMDIKGNGFSAIDNTLCKMQVLDSGEIVELQADCDVCPCEFCQFFC